MFMWLMEQHLFNVTKIKIYIEIKRLEELHIVYQNLLQEENVYSQYRQVIIKNTIFVYFLMVVNKDFKPKQVNEI